MDKITYTMDNHVMANKYNQRDSVIDIAKGLGIILVVLGHTVENRSAIIFIYSFHMPLFFYISGYLYSCYYKKLTNKDYIIKKIKTILIPYFSWGILSYIYWLCIERSLRSQEDISIFKPLINIFMAQAINDYYPNVVLWYLVNLFIVQILYNFINVKLIKLKYKVVFTAILTILSMVYGYLVNNYNFIRLPFTLDIVGVSTLFYFIGAETKFKPNINWNKILMFIAAVFFTLITLLLSMFNPNFNMMGVSLGNPLISVPNALMGIGAILFFSSAVNNKKIGSILSFLGRNSLVIMCASEPIKRIVIKLFSLISTWSMDYIRASILLSSIITIIVICICIPIVIICNKYLPALCGKYRQQTK